MDMVPLKTLLFGDLRIAYDGGEVPHRFSGSLF